MHRKAPVGRLNRWFHAAEASTAGTGEDRPGHQRDPTRDPSDEGDRPHALVLGLELLVAGTRRSVRGTIDALVEPPPLVVCRTRAETCPPCRAGEPEAQTEADPTRDR